MTPLDWSHGMAAMHWEVPYRLHRGTGTLVVGLHGMGEHDGVMARRLAPLADRGHALLVPRGPHPLEIRRPDRIRIGYAWYHYDGDEGRFLASMDRAARFLFPLVDEIREGDGGRPRRTVLVGFSQGAYLAYYLALRHPDRFAGVCGIAGRAKPEVLGDHLADARGVRVLHLHGEDDAAVSPDPCRASIEALAAAGLDARFELVPGGHDVTPDTVARVATWIADLEDPS